MENHLQKCIHETFRLLVIVNIGNHASSAIRLLTHRSDIQRTQCKFDRR